VNLPRPENGHVGHPEDQTDHGLDLIFGLDARSAEMAGRLSMQARCYEHSPPVLVDGEVALVAIGHGTGRHKEQLIDGSLRHSQAVAPRRSVNHGRGDFRARKQGRLTVLPPADDVSERRP